MSGRVLAALAASAGAAFVGLAMLAHRAPHFPIDLTITRAVQKLNASAAVPLEVLNVIGFPPLVTILYAAIVLLIFLAGFRWEAITAGIATAGAAGLNASIKALVERPRPTPDLVHVAHRIAGTGFPAGHVLNITAFAGFLSYLVWARMAPSWRRTALLVLLPSLIVLMGPARLYAGEHWPSDVLGGYLLAFVWLSATIGIYQGRGRRRPGDRVSGAS